jgi:hypothetical protein
MFGEWTERETTTINYEISTMRVAKPTTTHQKTSRLLMEQERCLKPCKLYNDDEKETIPVQWGTVTELRLV